LRQVQGLAPISFPSIWKKNMWNCGIVPSYHIIHVLYILVDAVHMTSSVETPMLNNVIFLLWSPDKEVCMNRNWFPLRLRVQDDIR
jgi:hypothetical protein